MKPVAVKLVIANTAESLNTKLAEQLAQGWEVVGDFQIIKLDVKLLYVQKLQHFGAKIEDPELDTSICDRPYCCCKCKGRLTMYRHCCVPPKVTERGKCQCNLPLGYACIADGSRVYPNWRAHGECEMFDRREDIQ